MKHFFHRDIWTESHTTHWLFMCPRGITILYLFMIFLPLLLFLHILLRTRLPRSLQHTNSGPLLITWTEINSSSHAKLLFINANAHRSLATGFHTKSSNWTACLLWVPHTLQSHSYSKHVPLFCSHAGLANMGCLFFL